MKPAPWTWIAVCAIAETIGMTAAASSARIAGALPADQTVAALGLVVVGGLVEGIALGLLQATWLALRFPAIRRGAWMLVTVLVAGLGWAGASLPGQLAGGVGSEPSMGLVILGALALGAIMGAVLGGAQAFVLRGAVTHPWRWVGASALAWTPTMGIIFIGATVPDSSWSTGLVIGTGALTGALAGAVLGAVSGAFMDSLDGRGRRTGNSIELPVQFARDGDVVIVDPEVHERDLRP